MSGMNALVPGNWDKKLSAYAESRLIPDVLTRVSISGYSRTGKSTLVKRIFGGERITFHPAMPLDDVIGGWALVDGCTRWVDGPAVRALKNGTCLHIDESNEIPAECTTFFYALLDDPAGITLPSGERVDAKPGFCVICTMNPTPDVYPHPIFDRFDVYLTATTLSDGMKRALGPFARNAENVVSFNQPKLDWKRPASVNAFLAAAKMRSRGLSDEKIAEVLGWDGRQMTDFLTAASAHYFNLFAK